MKPLSAFLLFGPLIKKLLSHQTSVLCLKVNVNSLADALVAIAGRRGVV